MVDPQAVRQTHAHETGDEPSRWKLRGLALRVSLFAVLLLGVASLSFLGVHDACTHAPPPLESLPDAGTPRASFCGAADRPPTRIAVLCLLVVASAGLGLAWSRSRVLAVSACAVLVALLLAGWATAGTLEAALTI